MGQKRNKDVSCRTTEPLKVDESVQAFYLLNKVVIQLELAKRHKGPEVVDLEDL